MGRVKVVVVVVGVGQEGGGGSYKGGGSNFCGEVGFKNLYLTGLGGVSGMGLKMILILEINFLYWVFIFFN